MNCEVCGTEVKRVTKAGTKSDIECLVPVDPTCFGARHGNPFHCIVCGGVLFPVRPLRDLTYLWPDPVPEKIGSIYIPEKARESLENEFGLVLAIGPGYYDKKDRYHPTELKPGQRVFYDNTVPWSMYATAPDGGRYVVKFMGEQDIKGMVVEE